jgi:lipase chaperone LimK
MALAPEQFWSLTVREFWIKHAAFTRAEDRRRSLVIEHSLISGHRDDRAREEIQRTVNALRRYPIKSWLLQR